MNSLVSRFASTSAIKELHAQTVIDDGDVPDTCGLIRWLWQPRHGSALSLERLHHRYRLWHGVP